MWTMVRVAAFGGSLLNRLIAICHVICDGTMWPFQVYWKMCIFFSFWLMPVCSSERIRSLTSCGHSEYQDDAGIAGPGCIQDPHKYK